MVPAKPEANPEEHFAKQPWESVVKKGNSGFSDGQVAKAQALKKEVIAIGGKALPDGGIAGDPEAAGEAAFKKAEYAKIVAQSLVPEEAPRAGETVKPAFPAKIVPDAPAPAKAAEAAPAAKAL